MSRYLLIVLLLATGVALADKKPGATHTSAEAHKTTAVVTGQTPETQTKTKETDIHTEAVQPGTQESQAQGEPAETQDPGAVAAQLQADREGKLSSVPGGKALGMSVLGNQEAPTSLVIVPWKTSEVGRSLSISPILDDSRYRFSPKYRSPEAVACLATSAFPEQDAKNNAIPITAHTRARLSSEVTLAPGVAVLSRRSVTWSTGGYLASPGPGVGPSAARRRVVIIQGLEVAGGGGKKVRCLVDFCRA